MGDDRGALKSKRVDSEIDYTQMWVLGAIKFTQDGITLQWDSIKRDVKQIKSNEIEYPCN